MGTLDDLLKTGKLSPFGFTMPLLSRKWTDGKVTADEEKMSLATDKDWYTPASGLLRRVEKGALGVTLVQPGGAPLAADGMLLTLFPQVYLRLSRCYAVDLESGTGATPVRPVPRYLHFAGAVDPATDVDGEMLAGDKLGAQSVLTIYDDDGLPIDPMAVAAAFQAIMTKRTSLQTGPADANPLQTIIDLGGAAAVHARLCDHAGKPYDNADSHLTGITTFKASSGLHTLDKDLKVALQTDTGKLPADDKRLLALGAATTGTLGDSFTPPKLPDKVTQKRDFFSLRLVNFKTYLLGTVPVYQDKTANLEQQPAVRVHETLELLADGNDVLGAAAAALASSPTESIAVAPTADGAFNTPTETGDNAHWPKFPAPAGTAADVALTVNLKDGFKPVAELYDDGKGGKAVDVILTLQGLPGGAAVRVYPRKWIEDAREERGDGAGGIVPVNGKDFQLFLQDPLSLRPPNPHDAFTVPSNAILRFDCVVVKRDGSSRIYGNLEAKIGSTKTPPASHGANSFTGAGHRGISSSGVLGLGRKVGDLSKLDALSALAKLTGEGQPRDATRWPTMARRELIVAGLQSSKWHAVLAAGRLTPETHSAQPRLGSPGGLGGRETQAVGVATKEGPLAYDIARLGWRRSNSIVERLKPLVDDKWKEPDAATAGTVAAAVLQSIAPFCETPEFAALRDAIDPAKYPKDFDGLVDLIAKKLGGGNTITKALDQLKGQDKGTRLFDELHREVIAAIYGRRDAQWALRGAIQGARRFIYVESPGFAATAKTYPGAAPAYAADLLDAIKQRMAAAPGLHVVVCTPKHPDFAPGYEPFAAYEADDRRTRILALAAAQTPQRIMAFHPVGFPGRPSRLESTVVVVDDLWALVGSSTFRRRGLTFDGGGDVVWTDTDLAGGRAKSIRDFRRKLMAARLGVAASNSGQKADARWTQLFDGVESFYVVQELLQAGGLGKIDKLWNGETPGVDKIDPKSLAIDVANPEGQEFADPKSGIFAAAVALSALASFDAY
jgi:hypothetical protein